MPRDGVSVGAILFLCRAEQSLSRHSPAACRARSPASADGRRRRGGPPLAGANNVRAHFRAMGTILPARAHRRLTGFQPPWACDPPSGRFLVCPGGGLVVADRWPLVHHRVVSSGPPANTGAIPEASLVAPGAGSMRVRPPRADRPGSHLEDAVPQPADPVPLRGHRPPTGLLIGCAIRSRAGSNAAAPCDEPEAKLQPSYPVKRCG